ARPKGKSKMGHESHFLDLLGHRTIGAGRDRRRAGGVSPPCWRRAHTGRLRLHGGLTPPARRGCMDRSKEEHVRMARTPRKLQTRTDFLVLGGGIAGLAALAEARRRGINAIGLEAKGTVGGRIRTARHRRVANYPIALAAEFVHGPRMREVCESLALTLVRPPSDGDAFVDGQ